MPTNLDAQLTKNILTTLGLDKVDAETQEKIINQVGEIIFKKVVLKVIEALPPEEVDNFNQALKEEQDNPGGTWKFLKEKINNFDQLVAEQIAEFKKESTDLIQAANNQSKL